MEKIKLTVCTPGTIYDKGVAIESNDIRIEHFENDDDGIVKLAKRLIQMTAVGQFIENIELTRDE